MKRAALVLVLLAALAGCSSTVVLGSLPSNDLSQPSFDGFPFPTDLADAAPPGDALAVGPVDLGSDAAPPIDLAQ